MQKNLQAIVLAAGKSSRFNTKKSKLIQKICGQEMIIYTTKLLSKLSIPTTLIVGYQKEIIESLVNKHHSDVNFIHQEQQLGTGHAVLCSKETWQYENILILNGDMPLINEDILNNLYQKHIKENCTITFVTAHNIDPSLNAYGKVVQENGKLRIIEAKDDTREKKDDCCINAGIYLIKKQFLVEAIEKLQKSKVTGELYITDLVHLACDLNQTVQTLNVPFDLVRGINTLQELWVAEQIKKTELLKYWMSKGVRFEAAQTNHIDIDVKIESDSFIGANVQLYGNTSIGSGCTIEAFSILQNSILENVVTIKSHSVIEDSIIKSKSSVGPFAHVHGTSVIHEQAHIGNFVDIKKSQIGNNTKIKHLSYIGNAQIGKNVNIGAGTITCNFNGVTKEKTIVQDNAYIGSNNSLIAPVTIGADSFTAAGSVITKDVPEHCLAIARSEQINKNDYAKKLKDPIYLQQKNKQKSSSL